MHKWGTLRGLGEIALAATFNTAQKWQNRTLDWLWLEHIILDFRKRFQSTRMGSEPMHIWQLHW